MHANLVKMAASANVEHTGDIRLGAAIHHQVGCKDIDEKILWFKCKI
jgi:hypothetical protein